MNDTEQIICFVCGGSGRWIHPVARITGNLEERNCPKCFGKRTISKEYFKTLQNQGLAIESAWLEEQDKLAKLMGWK